MVDLVDRFGSIPLAQDNARIPLWTELSIKTQAAKSLLPHNPIRHSRWSNSSPASIVDSAIEVAESFTASLGKRDYSQRSTATTTSASSSSSSSSNSPSQFPPRTPKRVASWESPHSKGISRWHDAGDPATPSPPFRRDKCRRDQAAVDAMNLVESPCTPRSRGGRGSPVAPLPRESAHGKKKRSQSLTLPSTTDVIQPSMPNVRLPSSLRLPPYY